MKTKIVATLGPASSSYEMLRSLAVAGVDVFRLNFSHSSHEEHLEVIRTIRKVNTDLGTHIAILADLQGPKIRIGSVEGGSVVLTDGQELIITTRECISNAHQLYIIYPAFAADVKPGENLMADDGKLMFTVLETNGKDTVKTRVVKGGVLGSNKGVNLPETATSVPSLTEKDLNDLDFILQQGDVHWIALSFVRSADDIRQLREEIAKRSTSANEPGIIAKIEKPEAVENLDAILEVTDGIMVARGDLGVELPMERVPMVQKSIVNKCIAASKPVIIATQMMEGMIENIRPTRAEVNDVANSVMDGADAVMLSGETSVGRYPVQVVETMQRIIDEVEAYAGIYNRSHTAVSPDPDRMISDTILFSGCDIARQSGAKAIIAFTHKGYSAYRISSQRPQASIFIFSGDRHLIGKLSLVWGVHAFYIENIIHSTTKTLRLITELLREKGFVQEGDLLVNIASTPVYISGKTNMLKLSIA